MSLRQIILVSCVALCLANRGKIEVDDAEQDAALESVESGEPSWCNGVDTKKGCNNMQKRMCIETCATGASKKEEVSVDTDEEEAPPKFEIIEVTKDTWPSELTRVMKTKVYKKMWPTDCTGHNAKGELLGGLNTDGFACERRNLNKIPSLVHPMWHLQHSMCCSGKCQDSNSGKCAEGISPLAFWEATKAVATADSLKVTEMETRSGKTLAVNVELAHPDMTAEFGVLATVEVRMLQADLEFHSGTPEFTAAGETFFSESQEALTALVTMQKMVWDTKTKVLFCPHASTTATKENINPRVPNLPNDRAETLKEKLAEVIPAGGKVILGTAIGHFAQEMPGFEGGREAHIIYKIFDASYESPGCQREDLYNFVNKPSA